MLLPITAFYGSLLAAFYLYLSVMVIVQRRSSQVGLGDGGDKHMLQVMRAHGNFVEYVPFALLLMCIAELNGTTGILLHVCGWWLIAARLMHAYGLRHHFGVSWQRFFGTLSTFIIFLILIVANLLPLYTESSRI
ncbi:MAPEG family protein [Planctobacterium marinum]|uniref:MAPEG family protein n=1 Tax=Planctobacterium marinum TaxID=1631968 RepID=UPI001E3CEF36|nr:MAPEG family protein [Planctobacterium marinum]MCC2605540.1 MAPEG family protein [Planctobacterium marinum]